MALGEKKEQCPNCGKITQFLWDYEEEDYFCAECYQYEERMK